MVLFMRLEMTSPTRVLRDERRASARSDKPAGDEDGTCSAMFISLSSVWRARSLCGQCPGAAGAIGWVAPAGRFVAANADAAFPAAGRVFLSATHRCSIQ